LQEITLISNLTQLIFNCFLWEILLDILLANPVFL